MKVIETGIDEIMEHLKREGSSTVKEISEEFGYPEDVVEEWIQALEDHGTVKIDYGLRGTKVEIVGEDTKEEVKEKLKKDKEDKHVCDECGRSFKNEHGLLTHKGMTHKKGD
ncbi:MAG: hypothetical protein ACLFSS_03805 [Candidatus Aenigmatarchaeota archaeon]